MSSTAASYCRPLLAVAPVLVGQLPALEGVVPAGLEPLSCSSWEMCSQSLTMTMPSSARDCSKRRDLVVGPAPLLLGGQLLDPLHQHPPVPASGRARPCRPSRAAPARTATRSGGAARRGGRPELGHPDVAGVERWPPAADGPPLAGGVPALEDDADRRAQSAVAEQAAVDQAQVEEPPLGRRPDLGRLLVRGDAPSGRRRPGSGPGVQVVGLDDVPSGLAGVAVGSRRPPGRPLRTED